MRLLVALAWALCLQMGLCRGSDWCASYAQTAGTPSSHPFDAKRATARVPSSRLLDDAADRLPASRRERLADVSDPSPPLLVVLADARRRTVSDDGRVG